MKYKVVIEKQDNVKYPEADVRSLSRDYWDEVFSLEDLEPGDFIEIFRLLIHLEREKSNKYKVGKNLTSPFSSDNKMYEASSNCL